MTRSAETELPLLVDAPNDDRATQGQPISEAVPPGAADPGLHVRWCGHRSLFPAARLAEILCTDGSATRRRVGCADCASPRRRAAAGNGRDDAAHRCRGSGAGDAAGRCGRRGRTLRRKRCAGRGDPCRRRGSRGARSTACLPRQPGGVGKRRVPGAGQSRRATGDLSADPQRRAGQQGRGASHAGPGPRHIPRSAGDP